MNNLRTNDTRKVGDLISSALLNALGPNVTNNYAAPKSKNTFKMKVEGGDPVRSAERVPYSSSHQLLPTTASLPCFDYAQHDTRPQDDKVAKSEEINVAAA